MPEPTDKQLYEQVKKEIYKKHPVHSAYRSGLLVQEYKRRGGTYKGKESQTEGLNRWLSEKWSTQDGSPIYKHKNDIFRPNIRITDKTPTTFQELTKHEIERARKEKAKTGHFKRFKLSK